VTGNPDCHNRKGNDMTTFAALDLCAPLLLNIDKQGFTAPTDIQSAAIPSLMEGSDMMGAAQTGGGKTAAFLLPILHRLAEENKRPEPGSPRVLILAPTRELAQQIGDTVRAFKQGQKLFYTVIYGGAPYNKQLLDLRRGVHIVIATPGRMHDHIERGSLRMDKISTFVLDECDRMLDMGFVDEVRKVAAAMPTERQTVMFSATMNPGVKKLSASLLRDPVYVEVAKENTVNTDVDHRVLRVKQSDKRRLLTHLLERENPDRTLLFVRTKSMTETIAEDLQKAGYAADAIHGDRKQAMRQRVLRNFSKGNIKILVATDVAARGLDISDVSHVINFDMPMEADGYIHRAGRTGRAGAKGVALSICSPTDSNLLRMVERLIKQKVTVDMDHPWHDEAGARSDGRGIRDKKGKRKSGGKTFKARSAGFHEPTVNNSYNPNRKFGGKSPDEEGFAGPAATTEEVGRKPGKKFRPEQAQKEEFAGDTNSGNPKSANPKSRSRKGPRDFDEVFDVDPMAINSLKSKAANDGKKDGKPAKGKKPGKPFKAGKFDKPKFDKNGKPARKLGPRRFKGQKKKQAA
jgi:ATP-dependent RNA helicase RhlE